MQDLIMEATTQIVAAYLGNNPTSPSRVPELIQQVGATLSSLGSEPPEVVVEPQKPAFPIKKSVSPDHITCLEDGKTFKSMKGHLRAEHNLTPQKYRAKWNLPKDYPMVAPNYSEARSNLARQVGLGRKGLNRKNAD